MLSENVHKLLSSSCSEGTWKQYSVALRKWEIYAGQKSINFYKPTIANILEFLGYLYEAKLSYTSINTCRSALSLILDQIEGYAIGEHPLVVRLMKGIGKCNPPKARYTFTWDVDKLLGYLLSIADNEQLCLSELSKKVVALIAIVSSQRVQTISLIKLSNMLFGSSIQIRITDNTKTSKIGKSNPVIVLSPYTICSKLCVVRAVNEYKSRTASIRRNEDRFFISFRAPHKAVTSQTLSHWLVDMLKESGIDTNTYKGHSYRHASSSKAARVGVNVDTIMKSVGWSPKSNVFAKYYNKPVLDGSEYSHSVLN